MTEAEFSTLMKGIKAAYSNSSFMSNPDSEKIWYKFLKNVDYGLAEAAAYKHIATCKFPPTISEILDQCGAIAIPDEFNWLDGWKKLQKVIGQYGYYRQREGLEALKEMDVVAEEVAERLGWDSLCLSENQAADRANFRACYERFYERKRESVKLSGGVYDKLSYLTSGVGKAKLLGG